MTETREDRSSDREAFMTDYLARTIAGISRNSRFWGIDGTFVILDVSDFDGRVTIDFIGTCPEDRGKNYASCALRWLCDKAEEHHVYLHLCIKPPRDRKMRSLNATQLSEWYKRYGFKPWRHSCLRRRRPESGAIPEHFESNLEAVR